MRVRGGNMKYRALRLDQGNFAWGSEGIARKTRIMDVVYNATNNELVRTKTLVKNAIVTIDAAPFRAWYLQHYGVELSKKKREGTGEAAAAESKKQSKHVLAKIAARNKNHQLEKTLQDMFNSGRVYAAVSSR